MNRRALAGVGLGVSLAAAVAFVSPPVIGGQPVAWKDFPATCRFDAEGQLPCTCVLVGPEALLTAAHCMEDNDETGTVTTFDQGTRKGTCKRSSQLDLAICKLDTRVDHISFERIGSAPLTKNQDLLLTGFGCSSHLAAHSEDTLLKDPAKVKTLPQSDNFIEFKEGTLCSGDSGGPSFTLSSSIQLANSHLGQRRVAGINASNTHLTSLSTEAAREFIRQWAEANNAGVCGIHETQGLTCRQ